MEGNYKPNCRTGKGAGTTPKFKFKSVELGNGHPEQLSGINWGQHWAELGLLPLTSAGTGQWKHQLLPRRRWNHCPGSQPAPEAWEHATEKDLLTPPTWQEVAPWPAVARGGLL